jgi:hypothetical protein
MKGALSHSRFAQRSGYSANYSPALNSASTVKGALSHSRFARRSGYSADHSPALKCFHREGRVEYHHRTSQWTKQSGN